MASYQFLPVVIGQFVWIHSISDRSNLFQPSLYISLTDETDIIAGATISKGERPLETTSQIQSEFGTYPDNYFLEVKYYF